MMREQELEAALGEIMARWDVPGMAVGIVEGGEIAYAQGFGVQNLARPAPVTTDSVFCIQSVSKCFTATAVMQLAERGLLDLDAPVVQSLPYFAMDDERCKQITIRQMLSHTSGMPDMDELEYIDLVSHPETDEGAAERYARGLGGRKLVANPGEQFSYSNIAYNVLGLVLAKRAGKPFEDAMREHILLPAGMPKSTFRWQEVPPERLAWPHLRAPGMRPNPAYPYHRADAPASFLHTTILELCHWAATALNGGARLLSPDGYARMWTAAAERGSQRPDLYEEMGLGWTLGHWGEERTVCHGGAGFGGTAFLLILPETRRAVAVLCNEESYAHRQVVEAALDALSGQPPRPVRVSWMVPASRALAEGGIEALAARLPEIQARPDEFHVGEEGLLDLALQLVTAGEVDLAVEVLELNLSIFPEHVDSHRMKDRLTVRRGKGGRAKEG